MPKVSTEQQVKDVLNKFQGEIEQVPPRLSNVKIAGKPARARARGDQQFEVHSRKVQVDSITLESLSENELCFRAVVSSGTYIRSLAVDIAGSLGTIGHLSALRRTAIGNFTLGPGYSPFEKRMGPAEFLYWLPGLELKEKQLLMVQQGKKVFLESEDEDIVKILSAGEFFGLGQVRKGVLSSIRLLPVEQNG